MGNIVWSINPDHDSMNQVMARMNDVTSSLLAGGLDTLVPSDWTPIMG